MPYLEVDKDGEPLTAERLRARGLKGERDGQIERRYGEGDAESALRSALADLVDAFLIDRRGQSDLFARAHRLGSEINLAYGCKHEYDAQKGGYEIRCPIFALHRPVAHSVAWTLITRCSLCGAGAFGCDHVVGREYDGAVCSTEIVEITGLGHLAFTANPDFLYTWHQPQYFDAAELLANGQIQSAGEELRCMHCERCSGALGPSEGDLDPVSRWRAIVAENR